jgi:DNA-directed RNA polymerase specialized sigma24 family protein
MMLAYEGEQMTELADFNDPQTVLLGLEKHGEIYRAIDKLPENLRPVAEARVLDGADFEVIAEQLTIGVGTARQRWRRARTMLQQRLGSEYAL